MRYNIKRLVREHEEYRRQRDIVKAVYDKAMQDGRPYDEYGHHSTELNRLSHVMSLVRQYIGKEVVERAREGWSVGPERGDE